MSLHRRHFLKLSVASVALATLYAWGLVPLSDGALAEEPTFCLPDLSHLVVQHRHGWKEWKAIKAKMAEPGQVDTNEPIGHIATCLGRDGVEPFDIYLPLDGRRLTIREYPELAKVVATGRWKAALL